MDEPEHQSDISYAVHVIEGDGKWLVQVMAEDESHEREFLVENHASSYAAGQRIRLGLKAP